MNKVNEHPSEVGTSEVAAGETRKPKRSEERDPDRWKKHLLRSSVPLEHDVARVLSARDFNVATYPYLRADNGVEKEFSIDVRGVKTYGPSRYAHPPSVLDVLIECKHRDPGMKWLFLQHPRSKRSGIQTAIQDVDLFSTQFVQDVWWFDPETSVPECYSGLEIGDTIGGDEQGGRRKGDVRISQILHGVRQLQYAFPSLITLRARWLASHPMPEKFPFFFVPILLTNAPLVVAKSDFGEETVKQAKSLSELGDETDCLILSASVGPDFYTHAQQQLRMLSGLAKTPTIKAVEQQRMKAGMPEWVQPSAVIERIQFDGGQFDEIAEFSNILIVNVAALDRVLDVLDGAFKRQVNSVKETPIVTW